MRLRKSPAALSAIVGTALLCLALAGCASGSAGTGSAVQNPLQSAGSAAPMDHGGGGGGGQGCSNDGGVKVTPCAITFNASNPGPDSVTVRAGGGHDTISETDDCASAGIATVAPSMQTRQNDGRNNGSVYTVTAGSNAGTCTAQFTRSQGNGHDGNRGHTGTLTITNQL